MSDPASGEPNGSKILLRYHEIALKGANRGWFENRLALNAKKLIRKASGGPSHGNEKSGKPVNAYAWHGRVIVDTAWDDQSVTGLSRLFGLSSFSPMIPVVTELQSLRESGVEVFERALKRAPLAKTFRVRTRRSDKALPETSMEIDRQIGMAINAKHPDFEVDLKDADITVGIELRYKHSYLWSEKFEGPGGLPAGTNGRVLTLISGGLDSPVAAIQALKRGTATDFIHFYGTPFVGAEVLDKIEDLVRQVNLFQPEDGRLWIVPFGKIQERIALKSPPKLRTLLYRRMMVRVASQVADRNKIKALISGESLGQVASQTLDNLNTIEAATRTPLLRPLLTYDKAEIIKAAQLFGTYDISVRPGLDCCTLFADRHPSLRADIEALEALEAAFDCAALTEETIAGAYLLNSITL